MKKIALVDSGPLGEIVKSHPSIDAIRWVKFMKEKKIAILVPEIIDYELRRELILQTLRSNSESYKSLNRLDKYRRTGRFIPLSSSITLTDACDIWAELRLNNQGTSDKENIDVDIILATQALSLTNDFDEVIIVTGNLSDIRRFCYLGIQVWDWKQALHDCKHGDINLHQELPTLF